MLAFHGKPEIKQFYMDRVRKHREADELIQGTGWHRGKGCAVGCTLEEYNHNKYSVRLGVPVELARLQDSLFERLPKEDALAFPEQFLGAIPVGADLSMVWPRFALWAFEDQEHGVLYFGVGPAFQGQRDAIQAIAALYCEWIETGACPPLQQWSEAWRIALRAGDPSTTEDPALVETRQWFVTLAARLAEAVHRASTITRIISLAELAVARSSTPRSVVFWVRSARDTLLKLLAEAPVA